MRNADASIFFKSKTPITENSHYTYKNERRANGKILVSSLQIKNVTKHDEGEYSCFAFQAGVLDSKTFTLGLETGL